MKKHSLVKEILLIFATGLTAFLFILIGGIIQGLAEGLLRFNSNDMGGIAQTAYLYYTFIWTALVCVIWLLIRKKDRPILEAFWTKVSGNTLKFLFIGLAIGTGLNLLCAFAAMLNNDIFIYFDKLDIPAAVFIFVGVFIQSSTEELICRGFVYQKIIKITGKPILAILINPLLFAAAHLLNTGITPLSVLNIFLIGVFFSLMVYYMDSIWCACAAHAAWNFTQNIILGLPNSGMVAPVSIFRLDASTARDSFFYNVGFGVEGTGSACVLILLGCAALWLWGCKHGRRPFEVWQNTQLDKAEQQKKTD